MIGLIGQSGSGKSTSLIDFIYRAPKFSEILLYSVSGSATTEPLYVLLREKIPEVQTFDTVEQIPDLESFTDKDVERLIVFDDFLNAFYSSFVPIKFKLEFDFEYFLFII